MTCSHVDVIRFYKYSDALGYQQILRRIAPSRRYEIMFETKVQSLPQT